jgi:hypothetical protein
VLRIAWPLVLPCLTLLSIALGSINNSSGAITHSFQIVSLVLLAQTAALFHGRFQEKRGVDEADENRMVFWSQQAIVATYLVSALTKLIHTSGMWFFQSPLIAVQIVKTTDQSYYNMLEPSARGVGPIAAEWIVRHPLGVGIVLSFGLLLELTAPLALLGRRFALLFGVSLLIFHETIHRVMKLHFAYNEYLLWIYFVNVPFWAWLAARRLRRSTPEEVSHPRATKVHNETN